MIRRKETGLDPEEKALLDSFDKGEWTSVKQLKKEKTTAKQTATRYLRKDARINIRISSSDLRRLKLRAAIEGLRYQTLIASILHKYATGRSS